MRNKLICAALAALALLWASEPLCARRDATTDPDHYFLREGEAPNSLKLLPPPPQPGSLLFDYDCERYEWGKSLRDGERGDQASADANLEGNGVAEAFSEAFGLEISATDTPEIFRLIVNMREDAGDLATREAKQHYNRTRPFALFGEDTCNPLQQTELSTNGSYPSGHTAIGWATALVLAEINPERQDLILRRGYEMGESRVICGYHFQSDVEAARLMAAAVVARLHADKGFEKQLRRAKREFARLKKQGKVAPINQNF
jgi:acid phosphatase (class A)